MKQKMIFTLLLSVLILLFNTGGGCDRTQLTGEVIIQDQIYIAGDYIPLQLIVPDRLAEIYRVEWRVEPAEKGDIYFSSTLLERFTADELITYFGQAEIDPDRFALYHAKEAGVVQIEVTGFFKQTNPQPITSFELEITQLN